MFAVSRRLLKLVVLAVCLSLTPTVPATAVQNPQSASMGVQGTVQGPPPSQAATIGIPANGQVFTSTPITISGLCQSGLLVKIFSNNIFVGSTTCSNGSYSLQIDLFSGTNALVARVYDQLDQAGPDSNTVSVVFNDAQFVQFGSHVNISSSYARRGADPGTPLTWPFVLSGGSGPYALSIDWGDGSGAQLQTVLFPGTVNASHTYSHSGVYTIVVKATDANGTTAYLQVVGVANGKISGTLNGVPGTTVQTKTIIIWWPLLLVIPLLILAFWLGKRHELVVIRRSIEASREQTQ